MQKKRKLYGWIGLILLCAIGFFCLIGIENNRNNTMHASAIGIVKVSGMLNVRTGPGTNYEKVLVGGTNVMLSDGQQITIIAKNGDWYHVTFTQNSKSVEGYVLGKYVTVRTGNVITEVTAVLNAKTSVYTAADAKAAVLQISKKDVTLKKGENIKVISEKKVDNTKWYRISFKQSSKTYKGYITSKKVDLVCGTGLPAIVKSSKAVSLLKEAGQDTVVIAGKTKVSLNNNTQVTLIGEKTISGIKYKYIKVEYNDTSVKGYLKENVVSLQLVKTETTQTPKPVQTSKPTETPKKTQTPEPTNEVAGMTDEQFRKHLENKGFPETYVTPLVTLHKNYPNWDYEPYKTGLTWSTVIKNESVVGLNLLPNSKSIAWKSTDAGAYDWKTDKFIPYDGSTWVTASKKAVKYYMDPRNFLDERGIFQFESLEYQKDVHVQSGVENVLNNTPMYKTKYSYEDDSGEAVSEKYSKTFMTAAKTSGVSPYHLASRVKQEVVISTNAMSSSVSGNVAGYKGIYNFYNIGANNSTVPGGAIANGLNWASSGTTYLRPWNTRYKSIVGGSLYIGKNYINVGQNTLYLQKFNVTDTNRYSHQYMGNVEAPNSEATKTKTAYGEGKKEIPFVFSIPVYNNMPDTPCPVPSGGKNPNNYLKTLTVSNHDFDSKFTLGDDGTKVYNVKLKNAVTSIKINATAVASTASVSGTGSYPLVVGNNEFVVKVTAENKDVREYKIIVTRKSS